MAGLNAQIAVDFSGIIDFIGNGQGIADGANNEEYINGVIEAAHSVASLEFDVDAASTAAAGTMTHMYEFGTTGITRGNPKFNDPTSPLARLWVHQLEGHGKVKEVSFMFRPAVEPNPRPSATFYGVPSSVIQKLSRKKYIFRNKAMVNELGIKVNIKPSEKPFNFVPFYGKPARDPKYKGRKYIFRPFSGKPMLSDPGSDSKLTGTFTAFWQTWWPTQGQVFMNATANERFNEDVEFLMRRYPTSAGGLEPVVRYNSRGRIYNRRRKIKARMIKLGALRGANRRRT